MSAEPPIRAIERPDRVIQEDLDLVLRACGREMSKLAGSTVLITGATGFVGRSLVESVIRWNESGGPPCVMTLPSRRPEMLATRYPAQIAANEIVVVDWQKERLLAREGRGWDYIVHAAATADQAAFMTDPTGSFDGAIDAARAVARVAEVSRPRRIVLISSGAVYGHPPHDLREIPEGFGGAPDVSQQTAGYGESKRVSELLFRLTGVDLRIARLFSALGPYQDIASSFAVPDLIRQAVGQGTLRLSTDGSARRSYVYASDLTTILIKLLLGELGHDIYNVGSRAGTASVVEVARNIAEIFGGLEVRVGAGKPPKPAYVPELNRLAEVFEPRVALREGLLRTCHSLHARGLIDRKPSVELGSAS